MRRLLTRFLLVAAAVFMTGCLFASQNTQKFTINPDGSGKCKLELTIDAASSYWMNVLNLDGKQIAEMILGGGVTGAEAWSDVSYQVDKDNRLHFKGTVYFKDLAEFRVLPMAAGGDLHMTVVTNNDGGMSLMMAPYIKHHAGAPMGAPPPPEVVDQQIAKIRANWEALKADLARGLGRSGGNARAGIYYMLPGNVQTLTGFEEVRAFMGADISMVTLTCDLKQMLAAVDKLMKDDQAMREAVSNGHFPGEGSAALPDQVTLAMAMLGKPLTVKVGPHLKPLFDYAKEAAAAHAAQRQMFTKLEMPDLSQLIQTFTDGDTGLTAGLDSDGRTILVRDPVGKDLWVKDVIQEAGAPAIGEPIVRDLSVSNGRVIAVYGKNTVASFDLKSGKFLGSQSE